MECDQPVAGRRGWALRCQSHKQQAKRAADRERRQRADVARDRSKWERKYRRRKAVRERRSARRRELHAERMKDPAYRAEYRRRRQRETLFNSPGRQKYLATQQRHNTDPVRAEKKRAQARQRYYELHPERPKPVCATCQQPIPYDGCGAPPKYHQTVECNPHHRRQGKAGAAEAVK